MLKDRNVPHGLDTNEQRGGSDCANSIVCLRSLNAWRCTNVSTYAIFLLFVSFL